MVHPLPGSTQVPQLALQHSSPGLQTAAPHFTTGTGSGRRERVVSVVVVVSSGRASGDGQTCCVHIMPGLTQTPQEGLQQVRPASQTVVPHWTPTGGQTCSVHITPGLTQTPQEGLQQVRPAAQTVVPHWTPTGGQTCCVHITPGLTQTPHEGLQQVRPAAQTVVPHWPPPGMVVGMGTHWALPAMTAQVVVLVHLTVAQGVMVVVVAESKLTGVLWTTPMLLARTASRRALVDLGKPVMVRE